MSLERAVADIKRFSQKEFSVEISFTNPDGDENVSVKGFSSKHHFSISPDTGLPVNSKNAHISVVESVLKDAGYTTRNADNEIALKNHLVSFADASGSTYSFLIDDAMPSETFGLIVCTLGKYING